MLSPVYMKLLRSASMFGTALYVTFKRGGVAQLGRHRNVAAAAQQQDRRLRSSRSPRRVRPTRPKCRASVSSIPAAGL